MTYDDLKLKKKELETGIFNDKADVCEIKAKLRVKEGLVRAKIIALHAIKRQQGLVMINNLTKGE